MRVGRGILTAIATAGVLAAAGCSGESGPASSPTGAAPTVSATASATVNVPKLSPKWKPTLVEVSGLGYDTSCQEPTSGSCAYGLEEIIKTSVDLGEAIDAVGGESVYVTTETQIGVMVMASSDYVEDLCEDDEGDDTTGCATHAAVITDGLTALQATMVADEAKAGL